MNVATFDSCYDTLLRLNETKDDCKVFARDFPFTEFNWHIQYENLYCDYDAKQVDFTTDLHRNYFDKMWTGWMLDDDSGLHSILGVDTD